MRPSKFPDDHSIIAPTLRPVDPRVISRSRRRVGITLLALGILIIIASDFVGFGRWPLFIGCCFSVASLFVLGLARWRDYRDIRKLYGSRWI